VFTLPSGEEGEGGVGRVDLVHTGRVTKWDLNVDGEEYKIEEAQRVWVTAGGVM
jgi:hypothetical protein